MSVGPTGFAYIAFTCGLLPWLAIRTADRLRRSGVQPTRAQGIVSVALTQGTLLVVALVVARMESIRLFPAPTFSPEATALAAALLVATLATLPLRWRWKSVEDRKSLLFLLPVRPGDLPRWAAISLAAGVVEEVAFRGALLTLLWRLTGSWWPAVLACVTAFGLVHALQGARAVVAIAVISIGIHGVVRLTGDLYTAMALHFVYDLCAGLVLVRLARRDGLLDAMPEAAAT